MKSKLSGLYGRNLGKTNFSPLKTWCQVFNVKILKFDKNKKK